MYEYKCNIIKVVDGDTVDVIFVVVSVRLLLDP